jgi:hypothetical protein
MQELSTRLRELFDLKIQPDMHPEIQDAYNVGTDSIDREIIKQGMIKVFEIGVLIGKGEL